MKVHGLISSQRRIRHTLLASVCAVAIGVGAAAVAETPVAAAGTSARLTAHCRPAGSTITFWGSTTLGVGYVGVAARISTRGNVPGTKSWSTGGWFTVTPLPTKPIMEWTMKVNMPAVYNSTYYEMQAQYAFQRTNGTWEYSAWVPIEAVQYSPGGNYYAMYTNGSCWVDM